MTTSNDNHRIDVVDVSFPDDVDVDVQAIRHRLGLSQREFARAYGFSIHTLRKWEQGVRRPEKPTRLLLMLIDEMPEEVNRRLEQVSKS